MLQIPDPQLDLVVLAGDRCFSELFGAGCTDHIEHAPLKASGIWSSDLLALPFR